MRLFKVTFTVTKKTTGVEACLTFCVMALSALNAIQRVQHNYDLSGVDLHQETSEAIHGDIIALQ